MGFQPANNNNNNNTQLLPFTHDCIRLANFKIAVSNYMVKLLSKDSFQASVLLGCDTVTLGI